MVRKGHQNTQKATKRQQGNRRTPSDALGSKTLQGTDDDAAPAKRSSYTKTSFLLWKDANPDIPTLEQAKPEYARMKITQ